MNKLFTFLGKPRTINHQITNRKVSWLKLFYDLIFAVVIARLTDSLLEHLTITGFSYSALLFGWFIWGWNEMSGYFDNHGNDSIINVLIINMEMILTGIGALFIPETIAGDLRRISIILMAIELLMALVWVGLSIVSEMVAGIASPVMMIDHAQAWMVVLAVVMLVAGLNILRGSHK